MKAPRRRRAFSAAFTTVALVALALVVPTAFGGSAPSIAFNPTSHNYGTIDSNTTASQAFTLTNSGGSATAALKVSLSGSGAFSKTADSCTAVSLGPKKSCSVTVQYAPTTAGSNDTGTLTASSKKPAASASASLTGKSTAAVVKSKSQTDCESFGGTFSTDPATDNGGVGATFIWSCNGVDFTAAANLDEYLTINADCTGDGGNNSSSGPDYFSCYRL